MLLYLGVAFVSAAGLAFEITLTRLFAISQGYHFGFLAVSLALLGFGASGTALALRPTLARNNIGSRLAILSLLFSVSLVASYLIINYLPFDSYRVAWERIQLLYLLVYYLALVAPFFLGGLALGLPLAARLTQTARVYAANLVGSGAGCLAALGALTWLDSPRVVIFSAMLAASGALAFSISARGRTAVDDEARRKFKISVSFTLIILMGVLLRMPLPVFDLQISPYKSYSQLLQFPDAHLVFRAWNAFSRVEVIESSAVRSAPGLSLTYRSNLPAQRALLIDGESVSPLTNAAPPAFLDALSVMLAYYLRPDPRVLMLKPGGGLEMLAALNAGAREIVAVEDNTLLVRTAREFAPSVSKDTRVRWVSEGIRSYVARTRERFDLVHLALVDPFRPATAGAYALDENYVYTQEAFGDYLDHLNDDGLLIVSRWLQLPPTEEVRVTTLALAALEGRTPDPVQNILVFRSFSTLLLMVKRTPFTEHEIDIAKRFVEERQFDWVTYPGVQADEANRFNVLREDAYLTVFQQLLARERRPDLFASYAYDITPPSDDRPFFFHFFKLEQTPQVLELLGKLWQPFGGSGYLILLALLTLSTVISIGLIVLPLLGIKRGRKFGAPRWLFYFACLGMGYLYVEIPLIQRFIVFLDHPVYAFATVLFTLLLASGAGSYFSVRLPHRAMLALLVLALLGYPLLLPFVLQSFLGHGFATRVFVSLSLISPLGFLMGIPFPKGLARLNEHAPSLVPLAWGINGCASVISSILATIGALNLGFSAILCAGAGAYALAFTALMVPGSEGQTVHP